MLWVHGLPSPHLVNLFNSFFFVFSGKNASHSFKLSQFSFSVLWEFVVLVAPQEYLSLFIIPRISPTSSFLKIIHPALTYE